MPVEHFVDEAVFEHLAEEWEALHAMSPTATVFNSLAWCRVWWRHFGASGRLHVLAVRAEEDTLVGLAPMRMAPPHETGFSRPVIRFVGSTDLCDYQDMLFAPGYEWYVVERLLAVWEHVGCQCALDLHAVPHRSPTVHALSALCQQLGYSVVREAEEVCPVVPLPGRWQDYVQSLDAKDRRELRRKMRKAGRAGLVSWYRVTDPAHVAEDLPLFFALHRAGAPEKAAFMDTRREAFFADMVSSLAAHGWVWLAFLLVDGTPAACYLGFDFRGEIQVYNSGLAPTVAPRLSPGWMLLGYLIEHAIALRRHRFNFLRGEEAYKYQFGARPEPIYHLRVVPTAHSSVRHAPAPT
ncbi:MAG: GNAT family N-acetyltransferase [Ardenticatenia bacterium]|nr:GNAT family N-acetyltransferase [Ardenticatenia bacterium]